MHSEQGPLVVLADDDEDARALIAHGLRTAGCAIHEASNGGSLLACVKLLLAREEDVALVLSDIQMPEADGISVASQLHALDPSLHVVLMTAHIQGEQVERARAAGVTTILHKPFSADVLRDVLAHETRGAVTLRGA